MAINLITQISQLFELYQTECSWSESQDSASGTMAIVAGSGTAPYSTPAELTSGYAQGTNAHEAGNDHITLDNVDDMIQMILPQVGIDGNKTGVNNVQLVRNNPLQFPYCGQVEKFKAATDTDPDTLYHRFNYELFAHTVRIKPHGSANPVSVVTNSTAPQSPQKVSFSTLRPKCPAYLRYKNYSLDVDFAPIDYPLLEDTALTKFSLTLDGKTKDCWPEWTRNCRIRFNPYLDVIQLEGGQLQFVENPNPNPNNINYIGQTFPAPTLLNQPKGIIEIEWLNVPADYVLYGAPLGTGALDYRATMLTRGLGCVNSTTFLGCPAETLLLRESPVMKSKPYGTFYRTFQFKGDGTPQYVFKWLYDISIKLIYWNPTQGNTVNPTHAGHNILPPKGQQYYLFANRPPGNQGAANPNAVNAANPALFPSFDFRWMFQYAGSLA